MLAHKGKTVKIIADKNGLVINGHAVKQAAFTWPFANTPVNEG